MAVRSPLGNFPCQGCRQITPGSPSGVPTANGRCPCGRLWCFFRQLQPKFPPVAERQPAGDRAAPRGAPADELICVTLADHPANFLRGKMLKTSADDRRMSTSGVLVRAAATRFLPDLMLNWPHGDRAINFAQL